MNKDPNEQAHPMVARRRQQQNQRNWVATGIMATVTIPLIFVLAALAAMSGRADDITTAVISVLVSLTLGVIAGLAYLLFGNATT